MVYKIKKITENWGDALASITFEDKNGKIRTFEITIQGINNLAGMLNYNEATADAPLPFWLIGKEIELDIVRISEQGIILN